MLGKAGKALTALLFLLSPGFTATFQDEDLDGVEDSRDKCPGTPILVLVDKDGCPLKEEVSIKRRKRVRFYIRLGSGFYEEKGDTTVYSLVSLALSHRRLYSSFTVRYYLSDPYRDPGFGDSSLFLGYSRFLTKNLYLFPGLRLKLPTGSEDYTAKKVEYSPSITGSYIFGNFDVFIYTSYTFRNREDLKDTLYVSSGGGYQLKKSYLSLSLDLSESAVRDDFNKYLSLFLLHNLTSRFYITLNYSYGLNSEATDQSGTIKLGIRF